MTGSRRKEAFLCAEAPVDSLSEFEVERVAADASPEAAIVVHLKKS
jgi:hypothetical protein